MMQVIKNSPKFSSVPAQIRVIRRVITYFLFMYSCTQCRQEEKSALKVKCEIVNNDPDLDEVFAL